MSLRRFTVYFCVVAALCVFAFGRWMPQMPAPQGFPTDLQGHTLPFDAIAGEVVLPPDPASETIWANVRHVPPVAVAMK